MTLNFGRRFLFLLRLRSHLVLGLHLLRLHHAGPDAVAEALGAEVPAVAGPAVDLALPLREDGAVEALVAVVAREARFVPGAPRTAHQLCDEHLEKDEINTMLEGTILN